MASKAASHSQPLESQVLADFSNLNTVPTKFNVFSNDPTALIPDSLPIIDFSVLTAADPSQRSDAIRDLGRACEEWGFFILVNHGMPEKLMDAMFTTTKEFTSLPPEEKKQYQRKTLLDPIDCGDFITTTNSNREIPFWRRHLKLIVHPEFHCPEKPEMLREVVQDYTERSRKLANELLKAISEYLGLEREYAHQVMKMDSSFQICNTNIYPPCPEPDKAIGLSPHTDPGLLTFLIYNGVAGLQLLHNGEWFNVVSPQHSILVNCCDQLEIFSNGRCRSVKHRAVVNKEKERISIVVGNAPAKEAVVGPAAPLVEKDGAAFYHSMKYGDYMESLFTRANVSGKSLFEQQMTQEGLANRKIKT